MRCDGNSEQKVEPLEICHAAVCDAGRADQTQAGEGCSHQPLLHARPPFSLGHPSTAAVATDDMCAICIWCMQLFAFRKWSNTHNPCAFCLPTFDVCSTTPINAQQCKHTMSVTNTIIQEQERTWKVHVMRKQVHVTLRRLCARSACVG